MSLSQSFIEKLALAIVLAEETADKIKVELEKPIISVVAPRKVTKTKVVKESNLTISKEYTILNVDGEGKLRELMIESEQKDYNILINLDGEVVLYDTFSNLQSESAYLNYIDAFTNDTSYILHIGELNFTSKLRITIIPEETTTFYKIKGMYNIFKTVSS